MRIAYEIGIEKVSKDDIFNSVGLKVMQTKNDINYYACMGISIQLFFSLSAQIYVNELNYKILAPLCNMVLKLDDVSEHIAQV